MFQLSLSEEVIPIPFDSYDGLKGALYDVR